MSANLIAVIDAAIGVAMVTGGTAAARWMSATSKKLDHITGIVAPDDAPNMRLDRRVEAIEQAHAAHIAWHTGGGKPPLRTTHG